MGFVFNDDDLVVFLGHADDANDIAASVRTMLEGALATELDQLARAAGPRARWRRVRVFDWPRDALGEVGNQRTVVDPSLQRADVAIFLFRWRVGKITWEHELAHVRQAPHDRVVVCAFSADPPVQLSTDEARRRQWAELLEKKRSLTSEYATGRTDGVVPLPDFSDPDALTAQILSILKDKLSTLIRARNARRSSSAIDLAAYRARIEERYGALDLEALLPSDPVDDRRIRLPDVFVEPAAREERPPMELPKDVYALLQEEGSIDQGDLPEGLPAENLEQLQGQFRERPRRPVLDTLADIGSRAVVLLGDPGAGKSTLTRHILLSLLDDRGDPRVRAAFPAAWPILMELREYAAGCLKAGQESVFDFLAWLGQIEGLGFTRDDLEEHFDSRAPTLVIFDGLDEIFDPHLRDVVVRRLIGFAAKWHHVRILVTSRILGYNPHALRTAGFAHHTLQDFDDEQVRTFVARWFDRVFAGRPADAEAGRQRIRRAIRESSSIRQLAGNPMLLTIIAIMARQQELPRQRRLLYEHACLVLVRRWDLRKGLEHTDLGGYQIGEREKLELLHAVAWRMQSAARGLAGNFIAGVELRQVVIDHVTPLVPTAGRAADIADAIIRQLRERNFILCRHGADVFGFVHRSFLEYFCASAILYRFKETRDLDLDTITKDFIGAHWREPAWAEVIRLIIGGLAPAFAGRLIDYLTHDADGIWPQEVDDRSFSSLLLATQCLAEVANPAPLAEVGGRLLHQIIQLLEHASHFDRALSGRIPVRDLLPAVREIGTRWPGREVFRSWFSTATTAASDDLADVWCGMSEALLSDEPGTARRLITLMQVGRGWHFLMRAEATVVELWRATPPSRTEIESYIRSPIAELRSAALQSLAAMFKAQPDVATLLVDRALRDVNADVRGAALRTLAEAFPSHPDVLPLLASRARHDPDLSTRISAVKTLAHRFPIWPHLLPLLLDRAVCDSGSSGRWNALDVLEDTFPAHPDVSQLLIDHASHDESSTVRAVALRTRISDFPSHPELYQLLLRSAVHDVDENVRKIALEKLVVRFPQHPDLYQLLRQQALQDPDEDVRRVALETLADDFRSRPGVVPLLRDRAVGDPHEDVRRFALEFVASEFRSDLDVRALLFQRAVHDPDGEVRQQALKSVAAGFPADPDLLPLFLDRATHDASGQVRRAAIRSLRTTFPGNAEVFLRLRTFATDDTSPAVRRTALATLAAAFAKHPDLPALFGDRAIHDPHFEVRWASLEVLATSLLPNRDALQLLVERTTGDPSRIIRRAALRTLATVVPAQSEVVRLLCNRALGDSSGAVRWAALRVLAVRFPTQADLFPLLQDYAVRDLESRVRAEALRLCAAACPTHPDLYGFLHDRAVAARDYRVRGIALETLVAAFPTRSDLPAVLFGRAMHDEHESARRVALKTLAAGFPGNPDTVLLLQDRATRDLSADVRTAALENMAAAFSVHVGLPDLLEDRAVHDTSPRVRQAALTCLTRLFLAHPNLAPLLQGRAIHDPDHETRRTALDFVVALFPDDPNVLAWLRHRAVSDPVGSVREAALRRIGSRFPGQASWLAERAIDEPEAVVRIAAMQMLAGPLRTQFELRPFLEGRLAHDGDHQVRATVLRLLVMSIPDAADAMAVLASRAVDDEHYDVRRAALRHLAAVPAGDPSISALLQDCAIRDRHYAVRGTALESLAGRFPAPPDLQLLLRQRAADDRHYDVRRVALLLLAGRFRADPDLFSILRDRASDDPEPSVRIAALTSLADTRPDDPRLLPILRKIIVFDVAATVRLVALQILVDEFRAHPDTSSLLKDRVDRDTSALVRMAALGALTRDSVKLAILASRDLDGIAPFVDPSDALPRRHLERARTILRLSWEELDSLLAQGQREFGWNPERGNRKRRAKRHHRPRVRFR